MNQVVVFGKEGYNTLGVIRSLGQHNVPVFLLLEEASKFRYCSLSKYVTNKKSVSCPNEGISFLLNDYSKLFPSESKTIIVPTTDFIASELDRNYGELSKNFIFPNSKGRLNEKMDKYLMTRLAKDVGISVPQTIQYVCGNRLPDEVVYPCMVKPAKSIEGTKEEIRVCNSIEELKDALTHLVKGHKLLLQQYIKKEYDLLLLGSGCPNGKVFLAGVFKKERWFSIGEDGSYGLITADYKKWFDEKVIEIFLEKLDYVGPFSIEFGVEKSTPYFYEINLRNDGTSHYFDATGFCNIYAWVMECEGHQMENNGSGEYWFIDEFGDIMNVFAKTINWSKWRKDKRNATAYKYKNPNDKKPMLILRPYMMAYVAKSVLMLMIDKKK